MAEPARHTINVTGVSGHQYSFDIYPKSPHWESVSGVYLVLKRNADGGYDPIYVGETEDLGDRFRNHHKMQCFERYGWTHLGFLYEKNGRSRLEIEKDILKNYPWICND